MLKLGGRLKVIGMVVDLPERGLLDQGVEVVVLLGQGVLMVLLLDQRVGAVLPLGQGVWIVPKLDQGGSAVVEVVIVDLIEG